MEIWRKNSRVECGLARDRTLVKLRESVELAAKLNENVNILEKQMNCTHTMKPLRNSGPLGGLDVDVCINCGWEYPY